jgi:hypothetical protein
LARLWVAPAAAGPALTIGYLELADDPRYDNKSAYVGPLLAPVAEFLQQANNLDRLDFDRPESERRF